MRKVGVGIGVIEGIAHFYLTQTMHPVSIKTCLRKDDSPPTLGVSIYNYTMSKLQLKDI